MIEELILIRPMEVKIDEGFICNSWLEATRHESKMFRNPFVQDGIFYNNYHDFMMPLLGVAKTLVACNKEDPDQIYGYLTFQRDCLHFCYVKSSFRKFSVAKTLIHHAEMDSVIEYSNTTRFVKHLLKYFDSAEYNPFRYFRYGAIPSRKS